MPPQVNAHVVKVSGAGTADDWDRAGAAGAVKWEGEASAYYREKADRVEADGAVNVLTRRTVWVDTTDADAMSVDTDDVIEVRLDRGSTITATAQAVSRSALDGVSPDLQTTRLDLAPA